jgi:cytoskeletal protein CcmA (bactofilin family)
MWEPDVKSESNVMDVKPEAPRMPQPQKEMGTLIGSKVKVKGEIRGEGSLTVQGQVDGTISFSTGEVMVDQGGKVKADVEARVVQIQGEVTGTVSCTELIALRSTADAKGTLRAPRIVLEDGCKFTGDLDTESTETVQASSKSSSKRNDQKDSKEKDHKDDFASRIAS